MKFKTRHGEIDVDFEKMEAYFHSGDLLAHVRLDGGHYRFEHPLWLNEFRIINKNVMDERVWKEIARGS